jgi:hypothetical protein
MILTEAHFNNIKSKIQEELLLAQQHIYVAVAWFTDDELFQTLLQKQQDGVVVNLVIVKDEINFGDFKLNFNNLVITGGAFHAIEGNLMHNKFCVIDGRILITGSYNWTRRAATSNMENIVITYDDFELAHKYIEQFKIITGTQNKHTVSNDLGRILKRLQVIKNFISLEEDEDLQLQTSRLKKDIDVAGISEIIAALTSKEYGEAVSLIDDLTSKYSQLVVYENPLLIALRLELRDLEYRSVAIDAEISEKEKLINYYNHLLNKYIGELLENILLLKKEFAYSHRQESQYSESEYQEAKQSYEEFNQQREVNNQKHIFELSDADKANLKTLYKKAAVLCHPDKFQGSSKEQEAEEIFKELSESYKKQDLRAIAEILETLKKGNFTIASDKITDIELLQAKVVKLRAALQSKIDFNESLAKSEVYNTAITINDTHFSELKEKLEAEYEFWRSRTGKRAATAGIKE